jgi:hypothetical protein
MENSNFHNDSENQNKYESRNHLNHDIQQAVSDVATGMLEEVLYKLTEERTESFETCREAVLDSNVDETAIIGLSVDDEIDLIEQFADDFGLDLGSVTPDGLRNRIDGVATWIVRSLGEQEALEAIETLEKFMEEYELKFSNIVSGNNHGWARHFAERGEGDHCWVYEYRNLEGEEIHIDVWEYKQKGLEITFEKYVDAEDVTDQEKYFDAT